ncbi:MAG: phosphopantetheine-binding protein [Bacteroidia bacterium]|nr:phosphopantetheine-binding protein [Bacteroidia bacterium]
MRTELPQASTLTLTHTLDAFAVRNMHPDTPAPAAAPYAGNLGDDLKTILLEIAECDPALYRSDARIREDLMLDSLDMVELVMICERDFGLILPDREWLPVRTVGELEQLLRSKLR